MSSIESLQELYSIGLAHPHPAVRLDNPDAHGVFPAVLYPTSGSRGKESRILRDQLAGYPQVKVAVRPNRGRNMLIGYNPETRRWLDIKGGGSIVTNNRGNKSSIGFAPKIFDELVHLIGGSNIHGFLSGDHFNWETDFAEKISLGIPGFINTHKAWHVYSSQGSSRISISLIDQHARVDNQNLVLQARMFASPFRFRELAIIRNNPRKRNLITGDQLDWLLRHGIKTLGHRLGSSIPNSRVYFEQLFRSYFQIFKDIAKKDIMLSDFNYLDNGTLAGEWLDPLPFDVTAAGNQQANLCSMLDCFTSSVRLRNIDRTIRRHSGFGIMDIVDDARSEILSQSMSEGVYTRV